MRRKPHIYLKRGIWWCSLGHHAASGRDPYGAYQNWFYQTI